MFIQFIRNLYLDLLHIIIKLQISLKVLSCTHLSVNYEILSKRNNKFDYNKYMINIVRKIVAGPKHRTVEGSFDLDLTYITERIIAMAFPASGLQTLYRNSMEDVSNYLNGKHEGHYMVINLSMRIYNEQLFQNRIKKYFWPDHQAPPLFILFSICRDIHLYLSENQKNVVVVHCNHGKGRTGSAIIAFLLYTRFFNNSQKALKFYNLKRFAVKTYGVDQPCQTRYLDYMTTLMRNQKKLPVRLIAYKLVGIKQQGLSADYYLKLTNVMHENLNYDMIYFNRPFKYPPKPLMGDVFIQIYEHTFFSTRQMCRMNINMFFLPQLSSNQVIFSFEGNQVKINHKHSSNFKVSLQLEKFCQCDQLSFVEELNGKCSCYKLRRTEDFNWQQTLQIREKALQINKNKSFQLIFGTIEEKQLQQGLKQQFLQN